MVLSSSEWVRRAAARTAKAAAQYRCEEGCGTMDQTPDHRSETAGCNRSKRSVVRVIVSRSREIIDRRVPGSSRSQGWGEISEPSFRVRLARVNRGGAGGRQVSFSPKLGRSRESHPGNFSHSAFSCQALRFPGHFRGESAHPIESLRWKTECWLSRRCQLPERPLAQWSFGPAVQRVRCP